MSKSIIVVKLAVDADNPVGGTDEITIDIPFDYAYDTVDTHAFTRTRRARDKQMRHHGKVRHQSLAGRTLTEKQGYSHLLGPCRSKLY